MISGSPPHGMTTLLFSCVSKLTESVKKRTVLQAVCLMVSLYLLVNGLFLVALYSNMSVSDLFMNSQSGHSGPPVATTVFCFILTKQANLHTQTRTVYNTWAHKCDGHRFISQLPDNLLQPDKAYSVQDGIELDHGLHLLQPPGLLEDVYSKLTSKVLLTLKYLYLNHKHYDWYLKCDDDTFVFVDHLRQFVGDKNKSQPVTYGYDFKVIVEHGYHSGGGSYLLSQEALHRIGGALALDPDYCVNTGTEDVDVARCLRRLGVYPNKSIDDVGRERFHPLSMGNHFFGGFPDWLLSYAANPLQTGYNCCSDTSISFHYTSHAEMLELSKFIRHNSSSSFTNVIHHMNKTIYMHA